MVTCRENEFNGTAEKWLENSASSLCNQARKVSSDKQRVIIVKII